MSPDAENNPFASHKIDPAVIRYFFNDTKNDISALVEKFKQNNYRGEIIGPEGTGKTTLLEDLLAQFPPGMAKVIELSRERPRLPSGWAKSFPDRPEKPVLVVDGADLLGPVRLSMVKIVVSMRGWGLLITAHNSLGLPPLFSTNMTPGLARKIIAHILNDPESQYLPPEKELERLLKKNHCNLRRLLFDLYDQAAGI